MRPPLKLEPVSDQEKPVQAALQLFRRASVVAIKLLLEAILSASSLTCGVWSERVAAVARVYAAM